MQWHKPVGVLMNVWETSHSHITHGEIFDNFYEKKGLILCHKIL